MAELTLLHDTIAGVNDEVVEVFRDAGLLAEHPVIEQKIQRFLDGIEAYIVKREAKNASRESSEE